MKLFTIGLILFVAMSAKAQSTNTKTMQVAIWDTYVTKKDGSVMHFDIIAPSSVKDTSVIYGFGREYLNDKGQSGQPLSSKECRFCHIRAVQPKWEAAIIDKGYFILEMENCD